MTPATWSLLAAVLGLLTVGVALALVYGRGAKPASKPNAKPNAKLLLLRGKSLGKPRLLQGLRDDRNHNGPPLTWPLAAQPMPGMMWHMANNGDLLSFEPLANVVLVAAPGDAQVSWEYQTATQISRGLPLRFEPQITSVGVTGLPLRAPSASSDPPTATATLLLPPGYIMMLVSGATSSGGFDTMAAVMMMKADGSGDDAQLVPYSALQVQS